MAEQFYTILTKLGKAKIANASALGTSVNFTKFQVGDSNGSYYNPTEDQAELKHKVWEGNIGSVTIDKDNSNWIVIETVIPADQGGFMIREAGIIDDQGNLIAIGKYPETYKPITSEGSSKDLIIRMILEVSNTASVTLKIDPTVILATKKDIEVLDNKIKNIQIPVKSVNTKTGDIVLKASDIKTDDGTTLEAVKESFDTHKAETTIQLAGGTANAITVTTGGIFTYTQFRKISLKAIADNTGDVTLNVDGKGAVPALKFDGSQLPAGNIKNGKVYDFYYDTASGGRFFLIAKASGNTIAAHVLANDTCSTDIGDIVGTMPNKAGASLGSGTPTNGVAGGSKFDFDILLPSSGYMDTTTKVHQTLTNLIAANLISGVTIPELGLAGVATISSLGGKKYASGNLTTDSNYYVSVNNLSFKPSHVFAWNINTSRILLSIFSTLIDANNSFRITGFYDSSSSNFVNKCQVGSDPGLNIGAITNNGFKLATPSGAGTTYGFVAVE